MGRVPAAAGADARRRDAGDAGTSSRSANAADAPTALEPFGRIGIAGNICVARRQRCPCIASSSRLDLARYTYARGPLYFHHGLLGFINSLLASTRATLFVNWYSGYGLAAVAIFAVMVLYAFRTSLGGRPLLAAPHLDD